MAVAASKIARSSASNRTQPRRSGGIFGLRAPRLAAPGVPRQALEQCLDAATGGLILLEAPAGFGKTYTLAQWCEGARRARCGAAWISLESAERSPAALARRLVEALESCAVKELPMDSGTEVPGANFHCERFAADLTNSVASHRRPVLLVLDDYQTIERSCADELLARMFEHMPGNLTVALATRRTCPIALSRVLLQRRLQRLDKHSLLFSKAEARAFFGRSLRPAQLSRLYGLTEGWPAALEMARLCLPEWQRTRTDIHNVPEFSRLIGEYCATEVLRYTEPRAVELLIECSVAESLEPDLCDAIRAQTDSAQILASLTAHETFMEAADLETNLWRLPKLLAHTLTRRAAERGSAFVAAANLRAAEYFEAGGRTLPAVRHYLAAHQPATAAAALERATPFVITLMQGDARAQELLDLIPHAQLQSFPRLALCKAYLDFKCGLLDETRTLLAELAARTNDFTVDRPGGSDAQLKAESLCAEVVMEFYSRSRAPLEYLHTLDRQMSVVSKGDFRLVTLFHLVLGLLYKLRGDFETAQTHFIQCEKLNVRERAAWTTLWLKYHFGSLSLARGQFMDARYHLQSGLKLWSSDFRSYAAYRAVAQLALAEMDYEMDALTDAQNRLDEGLYTAEHVEGWFEPYAASYEVQMMIHWHAGRLDKVEAMLAHSVAIQRVDVLLESFLRALKIRFELLRGRLEEAQSIIDAHGLAARWAAATFQDEFTYREWDLVGLCLARLAIHRQDIRSALLVIERLDQIGRLGGRGRTVAKASMLRAVVAHQQGNQEQAVAGLLTALELGHAQGYRRVFLDEAELVRPVLVTVTTRATTVPAHLASYAQSLLDALLRKGKEAGAEKHCPLSEREHEVLRELSQGYSNKLIARKLDISAPTVNFHVRNVFKKLGVRRRAAAAAEAHRRGWLS